MITETNVRGVQNGKKLVSLALKSTDSKPTSGVMNGSTCIEVNTGKKYVYDEEGSQWTEIGNSGGGGGGGGDFSTAEVTIVNNAGGELGFGGAFIFDGEDSAIVPMIYIEETNQSEVALYKGKSLLIPTFNTGDYSISTTGDITYNGDMNAYIVTGNGTITIS